MRRVWNTIGWISDNHELLIVGVFFLILGVSVVSGAGGSGTDGETATYDSDKVESYFIEFLNKERGEHGLQEVHESAKLDDVANGHAQSMARHDYIGHVQPNGEGIRERYEQAGLLPECELPITGSDRYYPGTENVAGAVYGASMQAEWAEDDLYRADSDERLAYFLFQQWLNSRGHRKAMLVGSADEVSLGLARNGSQVYAALELC